MIRLTDEEIQTIQDEARRTPISPVDCYICRDHLAKAQLKKVVEWLLDNELIPSYKGDFVIPNEKFNALLKEVG